VPPSRFTAASSLSLAARTENAPSPPDTFTAVAAGAEAGGGDAAATKAAGAPVSPSSLAAVIHPLCTGAALGPLDLRLRGCGGGD